MTLRQGSAEPVMTRTGLRPIAPPTRRRLRIRAREGFPATPDSAY
jgi:hypothetical protein